MVNQDLTVLTKGRCKSSVYFQFKKRAVTVASWKKANTDDGWMDGWMIDKDLKERGARYHHRLSMRMMV